MAKIQSALAPAAEALLGRRLTDAEREQLLDYFHQALGTSRERTAATLKRFTHLSREELEERAKEWDDTKNLSRVTLRWMV